MLRKTVGCLDHRLIRFVAQFGFVGQAASNQPCWFARRFAGPHSHFTRASGTELDVNGFFCGKSEHNCCPLQPLPTTYSTAFTTLRSLHLRRPHPAHPWACRDSGFKFSTERSSRSIRYLFHNQRAQSPPASSFCEIPLSAIGQILKKRGPSPVGRLS